MTGPVALRVTLEDAVAVVLDVLGAAVALGDGVPGAVVVGALAAALPAALPAGPVVGAPVVGADAVADWAGVLAKDESTIFWGVEWKTATPVRPATVL
ncbi:MAG: hypothetical protein KGJ92_05205, partial [Actinomycetales bacterium]|nr:hypothetical protein [Actinomycetales bacterium]